MILALYFWSDKITHLSPEGRSAFTTKDFPNALLAMSILFIVGGRHAKFTCPNSALALRKISEILSGRTVKSSVP